MRLFFFYIVMFFYVLEAHRLTLPHGLVARRPGKNGLYWVYSAPTPALPDRRGGAWGTTLCVRAPPGPARRPLPARLARCRDAARRGRYPVGDTPVQGPTGAPARGVQARLAARSAVGGQRPSAAPGTKTPSLSL